MGKRILNEALRTIVNAEKRGNAATANLQPISNVVMSSFLNIMKDRGKITVVELQGMIKDIRLLMYRQDHKLAKEIQGYRLRTLPTRQDMFRAGDIPVLFRGLQTRECVGSLVPHQCNRSHMLPYFARPLTSSSASQSSGQTPRQQQNRKDISTVDDPFDAPTYNIPEKPVTYIEGASYSIVILAGLGIAAAAGYGVFKELIFSPKEYKIFDKALERVQNDSQVRVRIGSPITGYGQESRNRVARHRIPHRTWTDQDGNEHVEVNFIVRGPHGGGKVYSEMFKDKTDKQWKFTFLIVEITSPSHSQLLLESYVPA